MASPPPRTATAREPESARSRTRPTITAIVPRDASSSDAGESESTGVTGMPLTCCCLSSSRGRARGPLGLAVLHLSDKHRRR